MGIQTSVALHKNSVSILMSVFRESIEYKLHIPLTLCGYVE